MLALVVAAAAVAQLLLRASGKAGHLTAIAFAGAAVLLLPAAASLTSVVRGLGPFDTPFEPSKTARNNQAAGRRRARPHQGSPAAGTPDAAR